MAEKTWETLQAGDQLSAKPNSFTWQEKIEVLAVCGKLVGFKRYTGNIVWWHIDSFKNHYDIVQDQEVKP